MKKMQRKVDGSDSVAMPSKEVRQELFNPVDQDNKDSAEFLETLT